MSLEAETSTSQETLGADESALQRSFAWCRDLTRRTAGNFYYAFRVLPRDRFRDTCALYAFMRITDDLGDEPSRSIDERREALRAWRASLAAAVDHGRFEHPCHPSLVDVVRRHGIPRHCLDDVITGVESDLDHSGFATFEGLERYCYHVAGVVGICCVHVWGMRDERAAEAAVELGTAFQLTNILRDLGEDARNGRVYLPHEDFERFGYDPARLADGRRDDAFTEMMRYEVTRAREYYERGSRVFDDVEPEARPILSAMIRIYRGLLDEIERRDYDVLSERIGLSRTRKLWISVDTIVRGWLRRPAPTS